MKIQMVSMIIPSRQEKYLEKTIRSILENATGEIEILPILDGYEPPEIIDDPRVHYIKHEKSLGMRPSIVEGVNTTKGEYVMKIDAHCIVDKGFDEKLIADCEDNMVVIPRRYRLDEEKWERNLKEAPVDYEHFIYPPKFNPISLHGFRWTQRAIDRKDVLIDDTLSFQGSCWFMKKSHFDKHKFLQDPGYQGMPQQEAEEISLTTWLSGGRVVVNKKTWYAHWFKGKKNGRGYHLSLDATRACYAYSYNHWVIENKDGFIKLVERFWPIPGWRSNWKEKLWTH